MTPHQLTAYEKPCYAPEQTLDLPYWYETRNLMTFSVHLTCNVGLE